MNPFAFVVVKVVSLYSYVIIFSIIMNLLIYFDIINRSHPIVQKLGLFFSKTVEPALNYIRKFIPTAGGIDLSPVVLLLGLEFIAYFVSYYLG